MRSTTLTRRRLAAAPTGAVIALAACGGGDTDNRISVLQSDFNNAACNLWETYGAADVSRDVYDIKPMTLVAESATNSYAVSSAPWWVDPNHAAPGAGYLNLVAVAYTEGWLGAKGVVAATTPGQPLDLRNADMTLRWRAPTLQLDSSSKLVLWFQTRAYDPVALQTRYVNYALTGQPLPVLRGNTSWQEVKLKLDPAAAQWTCLGSNPTRTATYGCARSAEEALSAVEADLGFVILSPDKAVAQQMTGAVEFDSIVMKVPPVTASQRASMAAPYLNTERSACPP